MSKPTSPCERWAESISLLAADCLPGDEAVEVRRHIAECPSCSARLREFELLTSRLSAARPEVTERADRVMRRAIAAVERVRVETNSTSRSTSQSRWRATLAAAAMLFAALFSWNVYRRQEVAAPVRPTSEFAPLRVDVMAAGPTLFVFRQAFAESDELFETLLQRHGEAIVLTPRDASSSLQELFP